MKSKKIYYSLLALIIIIALANIIFTFTVTKKNYMTDEVWSYGLSNGYYDPFIFSSAELSESRKPENYKNMNVWITPDVFFDYIAVNDGESFTYDSVWSNQSKDIHPPFYYAILHTICSFFPETFSKWFGFSINIVSFLMAAILLCKLCYNLTKSNAFSLLTTAFYSFSVVATDTFIYIRMYALVTVFYIALVYFAHSLLTQERVTFFKNYLPLLIITVLGTLTHYHFALFAFFVSAGVCFYLLFSKKWYKLLFYALTMLSGIALAVIIFPAMLKHITLSASGGSVTPNFRFNLSYIVKVLISGYQTGMTFTPYNTPLVSYCLLAIFIVIFITVPIWFIFRKDTWMQSLIKHIKKLSSRFITNIVSLTHTIPPIVPITFIAVICMILFFSYSLTITHFHRTAGRYLFPVIAIYYFALFALLYYIGKAFHLSMKYCKVAFLIVTIICSLNSHLVFKTTFGYPNSPHYGKTMDKFEEGSSCIIALSDGWLSTALPFRLLQVGNICIIDMQYMFEYKNELDFLPDSANGKPVYLLLDTTMLISEDQVITDDIIPVQRLGYFDYNPEYTKEDYLEYFSSLPYAEQFTLVGNDAAYYCNLEIYRLR